MENVETATEMENIAGMRLDSSLMSGKGGNYVL